MTAPPAAQTDGELVALAQTGDEAAAADLYRRHHRRLAGLCAPLLGGDRRLAEEIAHDALVRSWERLEQFSGGSFGAWVATIARRMCIDHHRQRAHNISVERASAALEPDPVETLIARAEARALWRAVDELPARQALAVRGSLAGRSLQAVADDLEMAPNAVAQLLHRARTNLRMQLTRMRVVIGGFPAVRNLLTLRARPSDAVGLLPLLEASAAGVLVVAGALFVSPGDDRLAPQPVEVATGIGAEIVPSAPEGDFETDIAMAVPPLSPGEGIDRLAGQPEEQPTLSTETTATTAPTPAADLGIVTVYGPSPATDTWVASQNEDAPIHIKSGLFDIGLNPVALLSYVLGLDLPQPEQRCDAGTGIVCLDLG